MEEQHVKKRLLVAMRETGGMGPIDEENLQAVPKLQ